MLDASSAGGKRTERVSFITSGRGREVYGERVLACTRRGQASGHIV